MVASRAPKNAIPLPVRLRIRNLYLTQGLSDSVIAKRVNLTIIQVRGIIRREGLPELRKPRKLSLTQAADARTQEQVGELIETFARETEELALGGMQRARECIDSQSEYAAKDFSSWSSGVRNFIQVARQARGLDTEGQRGNATHNLNVFVGRFETAGGDKPAEKPAIDV